MVNSDAESAVIRRCREVQVGNPFIVTVEAMSGILMDAQGAERELHVQYCTSKSPADNDWFIFPTHARKRIKRRIEQLPEEYGTERWHLETEALMFGISVEKLISMRAKELDAWRESARKQMDKCRKCRAFALEGED